MRDGLSSGCVAVTGSGGFIGRAICAELHAAGVPVVGVDRRAGVADPALSRQVVCDLREAQKLRWALEGARAVVHLAARVHQSGGEGELALSAFREVNVEGTRVVLQQASAAGVETLVLMSTVKAVGERSAGVWDETTPLAPRTAYGISKAEAENLARDHAVRAALRVAILRPPAVYGPGMKGNLFRLFGLVQAGIPLPFAQVKNRRSLVYVGNVVAAVRTLLDNPPPSHATYFVTDGEDVSTPDLLRRIAQVLGAPCRLYPVPPALLRAAANLGGVIARVVGAPITPESMRSLVDSLAVDSASLTQETGYVKPFALQEGLRLTAEWYRQARGRK